VGFDWLMDGFTVENLSFGLSMVSLAHRSSGSALRRVRRPREGWRIRNEYEFANRSEENSRGEIGVIPNTNPSGLISRTLVVLLVSGAVAIAVASSVARAADRPGPVHGSANNPKHSKGARLTPMPSFACTWSPTGCRPVGQPNGSSRKAGSKEASASCRSFARRTS